MKDKKCRNNSAAETIAVQTAKEALQLAIENMLLKEILKKQCEDIVYYRSIISEAICYCEAKKAQKKRSTAWLDEVANEL